MLTGVQGTWQAASGKSWALRTARQLESLPESPGSPWGTPGSGHSPQPCRQVLEAEGAQRPLLELHVPGLDPGFCCLGLASFFCENIFFVKKKRPEGTILTTMDGASEQSGFLPSTISTVLYNVLLLLIQLKKKCVMKKEKSKLPWLWGLWDCREEGTEGGRTHSHSPKTASIWFICQASKQDPIYRRVSWHQIKVK